MAFPLYDQNETLSFLVQGPEIRAGVIRYFEQGCGRNRLVTREDVKIIVVLEAALLNLGRCIDLVKPAGKVWGCRLHMHAMRELTMPASWSSSSRPPDEFSASRDLVKGARRPREEYGPNQGCVRSRQTIGCSGVGQIDG